MGKRAKSVPTSTFFKFDVGLGKKKKDTSIRPKISSNRITVLPGFLSQGVKGFTARRIEAGENKTNDNILKEDLHSLFVTNTQENTSVRRSARISKKNVVNYTEVAKTPKCSRQRTSTSSKLLSPCILTKNSEELNYFPLLHKTVDERQKNSRSLFKKIISSQTLSNSIYFFKSFFSNKIQCGEDFNRNILDKIQINFKVNIVETIRSKIFEEIEKVNDILTGKVAPPPRDCLMKFPEDHMEDLEHQVPEFLFPADHWQYATPPSQKLNITFYEESSMQPAVLCDDGSARNIYQLKKELDANLINHINPNNIEVDPRYMEQIAEFDKENKPLRTFNFKPKKSGDCKSEDYSIKPNFFNKYFREHLMSIQMRPKKTVKRLRFADSFTRCQMALDMSKPSTSNVYDPLGMETSELDFTFVNCVKESGTLESPKSRFRKAPRMDVFSCSDNSQDLFNNSSDNMEVE